MVAATANVVNHRFFMYSSFVPIPLDSFPYSGIAARNALQQRGA
jgi:hypothetical protein